MATIIMLGNGFDIASGLKSSFSDFIEFMWDKNRENYLYVKQMVEWKMIPETVRTDKEGLNVYHIPNNTIAEILSECDVSFWEYFLIIKNEKIESNKTWISFEDEIFMFLEIVSHNIKYLRKNELSDEKYDFPQIKEANFPHIKRALLVLNSILNFKIISETSRTTIMEKEIYNTLLEELKELEKSSKNI